MSPMYRLRAHLSGWRLALRIARRDLLKHKARAVIALVMVTLPVLGVVTADVLIQTADVSATEGIDRRIGTVATAKLEIPAGPPARVVQQADPSHGFGGGDPLTRPTTPADITAVLGPRRMAQAPTPYEVLVSTEHGREAVTAAEVDGSERLARGLFRLAAGRWPAAPDEVAVNAALHDRGVADTVTVLGRDGQPSRRKVVGTIVDATYRGDEVLIGPPGSLPTLPTERGRAWFVDGPPITWAQVQQLNGLGVVVTDRNIATHPDDYPHPMGYTDTPVDNTMVQVVALIVIMALIEVVLLAGPAIAVGARKQQHSLALLAASGGTPAQARRVILAGGVLLGVTAAAVGVVGGIGLAWLLRPLVQRFTPEWLGPFDVPWPHLAAVAAFGLTSAVVACLVPAWIASRQNVVAVLAGRRGDAKPGRAFPALGAVLFAAGVLMAVTGARGHGDMMVAWSSVVCVLGMVLLVPVLVSWVARVARRLPLPFRFAARDALRHRSRTTPAVAAVAATVAGVVALGISTASDEREQRETYRPTLVMGDAAVTSARGYFVGGEAAQPTDWDRVTAVLHEQVPDAEVSAVVGFASDYGAAAWTDVTFTEPGAGDEGWIGPGSSYGGLGADILITDGDRLPDLLAASGRQRDVEDALAAGRAVVFTGSPAQADLSRVSLRIQSTADGGATTHERTVTVPAAVLYVPEDLSLPARAFLPTAVAAKAGLPARTVGLDVRQPGLSADAERELDAALLALPTPASMYVERGYRADPATAIVQWVLAGLGAVLMLGGTLTASFLALSDARPDLATLSAVGATPRTRRVVASAYTLVIGAVGAVLGMLVGFVPGLAITWPLTTGTGSGPYIDVPWLMIGSVVVGLPLLTALVVGLFTRSRLPMVARLS